MAQVVHEGVPLPTGAAHDPERQRIEAQIAERHGRQLADQELEEIDQGRRRIHAHNYFERAAVQQGNQIAREQQYMEHKGIRNHPVQQTQVKVQSEGKKAPEFYSGSYGKDYEVTEYDVGTYDTKEYDVSEYKSVYES